MCQCQPGSCILVVRNCCSRKAALQKRGSLVVEFKLSTRFYLPLFYTFPMAIWVCNGSSTRWRKNDEKLKRKKEMDLSAASLWVSVTNMYIPPGCFTRQDCHLRERIFDDDKMMWKAVSKTEDSSQREEKSVYAPAILVGCLFIVWVGLDN